MLQIRIGYGGRRCNLRHRPSSEEAQILLITRHSICGTLPNQRVTDLAREDFPVSIIRAPGLDQRLWSALISLAGNE
jgi:hypothetical protein